ncbi:chitin deacetylase [Podila epigama]|nr:chitin deacetylase [Podila epigama]
MLLKALAMPVMAFAVANAQVLTGYPPLFQVPDVNSPEVQGWLSEIDLQGAPTISLNSGDPPSCPTEPSFPGRCNWICDWCWTEDLFWCRRDNTLAVTFDDGPQVVTPQLLDYLKQEEVRATFFLMGSNVVLRPEIVRRQLAEGHSLASHTWSHKGLTTLTNEQIVAEVKWAEKAIHEAAGVRPRYIRPPYGDVDNRVRFVLKKLGYVVVNWSGGEFATDDWMLPNMKTEQQIVDTFTQSLDNYIANGRQKGIIALEHDLSIDMVNLAKRLIPLARARGILVTDVPSCQNDRCRYKCSD